jgi:hypothetical protein
MWYELYTREKLREFEAERRNRRSRHPVPDPAPFAAPLLRRAGRTLRRLGEGLESWGAACPESAADGEVG